MSEAILVRGFVAFYTLLALFSAFVLWRNAAAPDALKNAGIAIASVLTLSIAAAPYLTRETISKSYNIVLFYDSATKELITGDRWNPYASAVIGLYTNLSKVPGSFTGDNAGDFIGTKGIDIVEKGILNKLLQVFTVGWDIVPRVSPGPVGTITEYKSISSTKGDELSQNRLLEIFKHNKLINSEVIPNLKLTVPPGTDIKVDFMDNNRVIKFDNNYAETIVQITPVGGGVAQQGVLGIFAADPTNMNRFSSISFKLDVSMTPKRFATYAPAMSSYRRWFNCLSLSLEELDWVQIEKNIEKLDARQAVEKVLSQ